MNILKELNINKINSGGSIGDAWWSNTDAAGEIISYNPATGKAIACVNQCDQKDYDYIVQQAQKASLVWREYPAPKRGEIVRQIGEAFRKNKKSLGALVSLEMGKSIQEGYGEVQEMIDMADFAVGQSRMLYGKSMHSERAQHRMYEQWLPLGIVGVVTPFNFPVAVWAWNAFIAAIAGNTVLWHPSPKAPLCALAVQHICNQVMKDNQLEGIFSLFISGDIELSKQLVNDVRLPLISFTGSSSVGCQVAEMVANRMGRCLLECSGNNALIVSPSLFFVVKLSLSFSSAFAKSNLTWSG